MSLLIIANRDNFYNLIKTKLENEGINVTIADIKDISQYNGTNPSPDNFTAVYINNYPKNRDKFRLKVNKNVQSVLLNYLSNGGRLILEVLSMIDKDGINKALFWGDLKDVFFSLNNNNEWNPTWPTGGNTANYYGTATAFFSDEALHPNFNGRKITQNNTSTILNNVPNEFTYNPQEDEFQRIKFSDTFNIMLEFNNFDNDSSVLNKINGMDAYDNNTYDYNLFLYNKFKNGHVLLCNIGFGGYRNSAIENYNILDNNDILKIFTNFISLSDNEICFAAGTKIETDQGLYKIEELIPNVHTINNEEIIAVPRTVPSELNYLICFEKDALGENIPNEKTIMTHNHKIEHEGVLVEALNFLFGKFENKVHRVEYNDEILYNVLLKKYTTIKANNLIAETLHPDNIISKKYLNKNNDLEKV